MKKILLHICFWCVTWIIYYAIIGDYSFKIFMAGIILVVASSFSDIIFKQTKP